MLNLQESFDNLEMTIVNNRKEKVHVSRFELANGASFDSNQIIEITTPREYKFTLPMHFYIAKNDLFETSALLKTTFKKLLDSELRSIDFFKDFNFEIYRQSITGTNKMSVPQFYDIKIVMLFTPSLDLNKEFILEKLERPTTKEKLEEFVNYINELFSEEAYNNNRAIVNTRLSFLNHFKNNSPIKYILNNNLDLDFRNYLNNFNFNSEFIYNRTFAKASTLDFQNQLSSVTKYNITQDIQNKDFFSNYDVDKFSLLDSQDQATVINNLCDFAKRNAKYQDIRLNKDIKTLTYSLAHLRKAIYLCKTNAEFNVAFSTKIANFEKAYEETENLIEELKSKFLIKGTLDIYMNHFVLSNLSNYVD